MSRLGPVARRHGFDLLLVVAAVGTALDVALRQDELRAPRTSHWFAVPAAALLVLPLLGRRQWPFAAPVTVWVLGAAVSFVDGRLITFTAGATAAGLAASFLLGEVPANDRARIGLAVVLAGAALTVYHDPNHAQSDLIFVPVPFAITWLAGVAVRDRGARAEAAEELALRAESERAATARAAVAEERARIARELHDIVAHAVSVIVLQVGAVRHHLPDALEEDRDALRTVEQTGRTALTEMRRLLGAMRRDDEDLDLAPQPGLGDLGPLLEKVRRAGLAVRLKVDGDPVPLPPPLDLSAYRVVQEGLTNALRHAHASQADVVVRYRPGRLDVDVRDDGIGDYAGERSGHGLLGVRERVKIYGGAMTAGAASGGGFLLSTRFPLDPDAR
jgi:signal transduction histidine kinase